jgi:hypothetical protein
LRQRWWIFVGLESVDDANLKAVNKGFNKPADYKLALDRLADRAYAITSFIFGMDGETPGAKRTRQVMESWPPGLPVYGLMTPYPATPFTTVCWRQAAHQTETRLDFRLFRMAYTPDQITIRAKPKSERRGRFLQPQDDRERPAKNSLPPLRERTIMFFAHLAFRGIYFRKCSGSTGSRYGITASLWRRCATRRSAKSSEKRRSASALNRLEGVGD